MLTYLTNLFKAPFKNNSPEADNRLAYISDINTVVDKLNKSEIFSSSKFSFLISQSGATLSGSAVERSCKSGGSGCWSCLNTCAYQNSSGVTSFTETSTGVYSLVANPDYADYEAIDVQVGTLPVNGVVFVSKINATTFRISTVSSGAPARIFSNTKITVTFYKKATVCDFLD